MQDWDVYQSVASGRIFYHNPTTGETSWKPPRGYQRSNSVEKRPSLDRGSREGSGGRGARRKLKRASLPRSNNAVFTFGGARDDDEGDGEEVGAEKEIQQGGGDEMRGKDGGRTSIVRDSIR